MAELLLEILSEEIPARMQARAAADLERIVSDELRDAGLEFKRSSKFVTPRRLTLVIDGLPNKTPEISEERKGPRTNAPAKAVQGFLNSIGLSIENAIKRKTEKGEFYFALIEKKGEKTAELLKPLIESALLSLSWPKSMRWADHTVRWVRPMQGILCLFDNKIVPVMFGPIKADKYTLGHRFLTSALIEVNNFTDYEKSLEMGHVIIDPEKRRTRIKVDAATLSEEAGLIMIDDPSLLEEVAGLVEWPVVLMGSIDKEFMEVPPEVLKTTMRKNQKYFALKTKNGELASKFIVVANKQTPDGGAAIVRGNERVLRARLADAKFFWEQDQRQTLASRIPKLKQITFHTKLGTLAEKAKRVEVLALNLAVIVRADSKMVRSASRLAKADLSTGMVNEFADLQGLMGRYYALNDGEPSEVANAIADHYAPQGPSDVCPTAPISVTLALADKIDTLMGFWAIDEKPTGSKDPFALRRAALGVIRLVIENKLKVPLLSMFRIAWKAGGYTGNKNQIINDLLAFFADRLKVYLKADGIRHDLVSAVFAIGNEDDFNRLLARVRALTSFIDSDDGVNLLIAYKRAVNILRIEEKKDNQSYQALPNPDRLEQEEEKKLEAALSFVVDGISQNLADEAYSKVIIQLAGLRAPIDIFFDKVTVNCEDRMLRVNRLGLLSQIRDTMNRIADFSQIEGGER
ncbi:MAG TPA: glycine--tRNA ligase subunit beta [Rhodospirillales bacterium]|jgi:glycyl-tRNA synthetase beta chain|nr:glycine--tRNA ligase subunit beta [Rhodospirillales bacterium]HIL76382.1 glycine--tRNA ligase subunit beta [Rhodospirillales bacterium]